MWMRGHELEVEPGSESYDEGVAELEWGFT